MKKLLFSILILILASNSFAQAVQGRLKQGSTPNSVIIALRANGNITGQITNVQFVLQVPASVTPVPTASIKNNPVASYIPTENYLMPPPIVEGEFRNYLFAATASGTPAFNFTNGAEVNFLEVAFSGGPLTPQEVRLAQLPNGGPTIQYNFYIEIAGIDRTNVTSMFYGTAASNSSSGYAGYSFDPLGNVILPVNWLKFTAVRQGGDVMLNWDVANEQNTDHYELEVSTNGSNFTSFGSKQRSSGTGTKNYSHLDQQVGRYNSKILHYRIKQYDLDGKFSYSPVKTVRLDLKGETSLFPNPAKEGFTLTIPYLNPNQDKVQLHLVNAVGQVIERKDITRVAAADYYYNLQSSLITSGEYLLKIFEDGQLTETKRVLIKK